MVRSLHTFDVLLHLFHQIAKGELVSRVLKVLRRPLLLQILSVGLVRSALQSRLQAFLLALRVLINAIKAAESLSIESQLLIGLLIPMCRKLRRTLFILT